MQTLHHPRIAASAATGWIHVKKKKKVQMSSDREEGKKAKAKRERQSERSENDKMSQREKEWNDPFYSSNTEAKYSRGSLWLVVYLRHEAAFKGRRWREWTTKIDSFNLELSKIYKYLIRAPLTTELLHIKWKV